MQAIYVMICPKWKTTYKQQLLRISFGIYLSRGFHWLLLLSKTNELDVRHRRPIVAAISSYVERARVLLQQWPQNLVSINCTTSSRESFPRWYCLDYDRDIYSPFRFCDGGSRTQIFMSSGSAPYDTRWESHNNKTWTIFLNRTAHELQLLRSLSTVLRRQWMALTSANFFIEP